MINKMLKGNLRKSGLILISIILLSVTTAYCVDSSVKIDPREWTKVVEAAKREGKLVMLGDPQAEWKKSLADMFMLEYPEINVEYNGMISRNFWPRVRQER